MGVKEFFKPKRKNYLLTIVLFVILFYLFSYCVIGNHCEHPPCKNATLELIGCVANIVPFLFVLLIGRFLEIIPFPIDVFFMIFIYFAVPALWAHFLSCVIIGIYSFIRRKVSSKK